ncbi:MAG: hypothetical protein HGN29_07240 [Asgard group archaeon]|nr:hypothetical protein [Asgard group archaeon]
MKKKPSFFIILFLSFIPFSVLANSVEEDTYFTIQFLISDTQDSRIAWAEVISEELSKIGIKVVNNIVKYSEIGPRTWSYPFSGYDYIPEYTNGGYDILYIGWSWDLDLNLQGLYETAAITPNGDNHYQYSNLNFDNILNQYMVEQNPIKRENFAHQLQSYLYEDLPAICLYYKHSLMAIRNEVSGIDDVLLRNSLHRAENWMNSEDQIIKYGVPATFFVPNNFKTSFSYFSNLWPQCVYGSLFQKNPLTHLWSPIIASDYTISSNKLSITVDTDINAKFSDGSQVLAEDVKYSYELYMTQKLENPDRYNELVNWFENNDSIEIIDSDTVKFTFTSIHNFPLSLLSYGIIDRSLVEPAIIAYGYSIFDEEPLTGNVQDSLVKSCGPFKLDSFRPDKISLVPNPYWSDLVSSGGVNAKLNELSFVTSYDLQNALDELNTDVIDVVCFTYSSVARQLINKSVLTYDDIDGLAGISGIQVRDNQHEEMSINLKHPIIGTGELTPKGTVEAAKFVRKAINHCIPRKNLIASIFSGLGAPGITPVPEKCVGFDDSLLPYEYNLTLAKSYLKQAGYGVKETPTETDKTSFNGFYLFIIMILSLSCLLRLKRNNK